jgi:ferric-dicitrate binding protein FerR (iron transport regulator)
MNKQQYIEKWLAGTLTGEEKALFEKTEDFQSLQRLDTALKQFQPKPFNADLVFEQLKARKQKTAKVVSFNWGLVYRIAAVLVIGLGIYYYLNTTLFKETDVIALHSTLAGETKEIVLPDNSVVTLNALSSLSYSNRNWDKDRSINLKGEAYFDVVKGGSFNVVTSQGKVSVLGTRFTVKDRANYYEVVCYEGRVEVKASGKPVQLTQHDYYRESFKSIVTAHTNMETVPSWLHYESSFQSVPYFEVIHELERQYNVTVNAQEVDTLQVFTGKFPNNDLHTALRAISIPLRLSYQVNGNEILVFHGKENK